MFNNLENHESYALVYAVITREIKIFRNNLASISLSVFCFSCNQAWNWNKLISAAERVLKLFQNVGKYSQPEIISANHSVSPTHTCCQYQVFVREHILYWKLEVGRVPGDYPGIALPGITRTRPGITLKYGWIRILGICLDFCDSQLYLTHSETQSGHLFCLATTVLDARHCGVMRDR